MLKFLVAGLVAMLLLVGCTPKEKVVVEPPKQEIKEKTVEDALKNYKHVTIKEYSETGSHVNVVITLKESIGEGTQVVNVLNRTKDVVKAMPDDKETMTVGLIYKETRVLQFTQNMKTGERTIDKMVPYVEKFVKMAK